METWRQPDTIVGAAQTANHLRDGKNPYVGPLSRPSLQNIWPGSLP